MKKENHYRSRDTKKIIKIWETSYANKFDNTDETHFLKDINY